MARDPYIAPPPNAAETYGNVNVAQVRHVDGRRNRSKKDQEQFNTKVRRGFAAQVDDLRRDVAAELKRDITRGEFLEMMFAGFEASRSEGNLADALQALRRPEIPPQDLAHGRKQLLTFYASRDVEEALAEIVKTRKWSLGAVVEDMMAKAARLMQLEQGAMKKKR